MQVDVIAVHNTIGEVKPLWILQDGNKSKIDAINSIINIQGLIVYHCTIKGHHASLRFDGANWFID